MGGGGGGLFDFRVTPNPNFMLDVNLEVEFDNSCISLNRNTIALSKQYLSYHGINKENIFCF